MIQVLRAAVGLKVDATLVQRERLVVGVDALVVADKRSRRSAESDVSLSLGKTRDKVNIYRLRRVLSCQQQPSTHARRQAGLRS